MDPTPAYFDLSLTGPAAGWSWQTTVERVVDGDTLVLTFHRRVVLDLGFRDVATVNMDRVHQPVRLVGEGGRPVDAYELHGEDRGLGLKAKAAVEAIVAASPARFLTVRTWKPDPSDKYGRWLVEVPAQPGLNLVGPSQPHEAPGVPVLTVHPGLAELLVGMGLARWRDGWSR